MKGCVNYSYECPLIAQEYRCVNKAKGGSETADIFTGGC